MKFSGIACALTTVFGLAAVPPLYHLGQGNLTPQPAPDNAAIDSIVVFTGAATRVETGYELFRTGAGNVLMVSGNDYARHVSEDTLKALSDTNSKNIYIDDLAGSTIENAQNTARWAKENHVKNILLITSESHIRRSYFELRRLLPDTVQLVTRPVPDTYRNGTFDNEGTRLLCRVYETFLNGSFCYQTRDMAREWTNFPA